jgi:hypothetical protein
VNTRLQNNQFEDVGDCDRPRNRPRGDGWGVGGYYYVDAAHVPDPATDQEPNRPRSSPTSADLEAAERFKAELQRAIDDVDWSQPF